MSDLWLQTASGLAFDLLDPKPEQICIGDIATALSRLVRFTGHSPYSVAQHSVAVSRMVPARHALAGLLHDSHEAYCGDVATPIKRAIGPAWRTLEDRCWAAVAAKFGLDVTIPEEVKRADLADLSNEKRAFLPHWPREWFPMPAPAGGDIRVWDAGEARAVFLGRFRELGGVT